MKILIVIASLVLVSSCGNQSQMDKSLTVASVINGKVVGEKDAIKAGTVAILNTRTNYLCTGTLIAPNIVLTAAHCALDKSSSLKILFALDVDDLLNSLEPDLKQQRILQVTDLRVSPNWAGNDESREIDRGDIALMKFKGQIPSDYRVVPMVEDDQSVKIGTKFSLAGYGVSLVDMEQIDAKKYKKLEQALESGEVICDNNRLNCFRVDYSGDGVLRQTEAPVNFIHETEFFVNESKSGTCSGDSGGPAYILDNGQYKLMAVTSRGSQMCNDIGVYTRVTKYKKWIADTIPVLK